MASSSSFSPFLTLAVYSFLENLVQMAFLSVSGSFISSHKLKTLHTIAFLSLNNFISVITKYIKLVH